MKIEHCISQLLYRYQCVTVPGFGAFLTSHQPAQIDEASHSFYPPKKIVSFNGLLKNNDGLLANHLATSEKLSYSTAVSLIENEVTHWNQKIVSIGFVELKNIGKFTLNSENNLVFTAYDQINYLKESFGLSSFVSPNVLRETYKQEVESLEEKIPIALTPERREHKPWLRYAAIFALSFGVLGGISFKLYSDYEIRVEKETLAVQQKVQQKITERIQEATFFIDKPLPSVTLTISSEKLPYHVVAGAFRIESNADKILKRLIDSGFKARRIDKNKHGLFPVLYGSYSSYGEAYQAMKKIQKSDNPEAWLLIDEL